MVSINQIQCGLCERSFKNVRALGNHIAWVHKISKEQYYCSFLKKSDQEGTCECGNKTKFLDLGSGYRKFCSQKCSAIQRGHVQNIKLLAPKKFGVEISQNNRGTVTDKNLQKALDLKIETGSRRKTQLFYVYIYLDPQKFGRFSYENLSFLYEPFYIGKGQGKRYCDHLRRLSKLENKHFRNRILKIVEANQDVENYILILRDSLSEQEAFELEKSLIEEIGRADLKKGPLTNLTGGGDGQRSISVETREKMRQAKLGRLLSEEHRRKIGEAQKGKPKHSEEVKKKISKKHLGMKASAEAKRKMSEARRGRKLSEEHKKKLSEAKRGSTTRLLGAVLSEEHKRKIAESVKTSWKTRRESRIYD